MNRPGRIALHGGGEFHPGDEPFLRAILEAAAARAGVGPPVARPDETGDGPRDHAPRLRVVLLPTAAAGERPEMAVDVGSAAFRRVASEAGIAIDIQAAMVVDAASAAAPGKADRLARADLVYLPGGDPGRLAAILPGSPAWGAVLSAHARGAVVAGASAGAMILAAWTWTGSGGAIGLGLVPGIVVVPHAERVARGGWAGTFARRVPPGIGPLGALGLDERTGIVSEPDAARDGMPVAWRVVGPGVVHWTPAGERTIRDLRHGDTLSLDGD